MEKNEELHTLVVVPEEVIVAEATERVKELLTKYEGSVTTVGLVVEAMHQIMKLSGFHMSKEDRKKLTQDLIEYVNGEE